MAIKHINIGAAANDKTGTPARQAGQMINENFDYLDGKISNVNKIVTSGTSVLVGPNLIINVGWVWEINGQQFFNPEDVVVNFPYAATGKQRLDRVVFNTSNTFTRVVGTESVSNPFVERVPDDTIDFGISLVTDSSVGDPSTPIIGDVYVQKNESQDYVVSYGAATVVEQINLIDNRLSVSITGAITDVKSVQLSSEFIRPGKPHYFKNRTNHNVKIWHNAGTGNIKYFFSNGFNLTVKPNEVIEFNLNSNDSSNLKFEFVGILLTDVLTQTTDQDVSGLKVFLAGKLGLRNIANTFTSLFSNSNTAARTYTLQDRNGTLLDNIKIVLAPIDGDLLDFGTYLENTFTLKRVFASGERNLDFESMSTYGITSVNRFRFRLKNYTDSAVYNALMIETTTIDAVAKVTVGGDLVVTGNIQGTLSPAKINFAPIDGDLLNFGTYLENTFTLKRVFISGERNIDFESMSTYGTESVNRFRFRLKNYTDSAVYNALMIETTTIDAVAKVTVGGDLIINRNLSIIGNLSPSKIALVPNDINILNAGVNNEQLFDLKRSFSGSNRNLDFELSSSYGVTSTTRYRFRIKNYNDSALFNALEIETTNVDGAALVKVTGTLKSSKHDLSALGLYADDSAAAAGGVAIGFGYINSSTGAMHRRLT